MRTISIDELSTIEVLHTTVIVASSNSTAEGLYLASYRFVE